MHELEPMSSDELIALGVNTLTCLFLPSGWALYIVENLNFLNLVTKNCYRDDVLYCYACAICNSINEPGPEAANLETAEK